jgi:hypothetical protein
MKTEVDIGIGSRTFKFSFKNSLVVLCRKQQEGGTEGPRLAQCYRIAFGRNFIKVFATKLYMQEQLQIYML